MKHIGVFGHSMGGRTAIYLAQNDDIQAAIAYDGGNAESAASRCPLMIIEAERQGDPLEVGKLAATVNGAQNAPIYDVKLANAGHANFTDLPYITRLHWILALSGSINQNDAEQTINAYTLAFFNKCLLLQETNILDLHCKSATVKDVSSQLVTP